MITALFADENGEIFDDPEFLGLGRIGAETILLKPQDLIPLPEGADLMLLPQRQALGFKNNKIVTLSGQAVAAILPAGYTRTYLPAYQEDANTKALPLYGYTAVVLYKDELHVAALKTDDATKWNPLGFNTNQLKKLVNKTKKELADNRIVEQLAKCSLQWHCCTAQNLFYRRWEAGVPVSPVCNANCYGCISLQPAECCPSPQSRIDFKPTPQEIAEVGTYHLEYAPEGIISFGQGCEGEPSLAADNIAAGIKIIRTKTSAGQININTNAGYTEGIKKIVDSGLDTMRVSIISAINETHDAYYKANYSLDNVKESINYAKSNGVFVSLNMLYFPGLNDRLSEFEAWESFLAETKVDMIQLRNLNVDPNAFLKIMPQCDSKMLGTLLFIEKIKQKFPQLVLGSFSHYLKK